MSVLSAEDTLVSIDDETAAEPKYPHRTRLAIIVGLSTALWGLVIVGAWGLYSLIA